GDPRLPTSTLPPPVRGFAMSRAVVRALALGVFALLAALPCPARAEPPKFTEEREAAALHFVRKHCPELVPLLDDLKKNARPAYELQIRETFQVTEMLADIKDDDPKRYELELKMWKAENQALVLVARLATTKEEGRKSVEDQLRAVAKELVQLELQGLEHRVEVLQAELTTAKDDLTKFRAALDRTAKERFEELLDKARKKKP
ncbi:MAG: hypothetical protein K2V38_22345, partial [Gemmataceae bacterium]|nr:hypothetical protein [Gemmataceae bacterium]